MDSMIINLATTLATVVGWYTIAFLQGSGVIDKITNFDQWIGGGIFGAIVFFILKWALARNDKLTDKIHEQYDERLKELQRIHEEQLMEVNRHFEEIKALIVREKT